MSVLADSRTGITSLCDIQSGEQRFGVHRSLSPVVVNVPGMPSRATATKTAPDGAVRERIRQLDRSAAKLFAAFYGRPVASYPSGGTRRDVTDCRDYRKLACEGSFEWRNFIRARGTRAGELAEDDLNG